MQVNHFCLIASRCGCAHCIFSPAIPALSIPAQKSIVARVANMVPESALAGEIAAKAF
jgi:hypothetical protein